MKNKTLPDELDNLAEFEKEASLEIPLLEVVAGLAEDATPKHFRRLKRQELVHLGDYVSNNQKGFELWDGPRGFQAGSFIKPIYRRTKVPSSINKKTE